MNTVPDSARFDVQIRRLIYDELIECGVMPGAVLLADRLGQLTGCSDLPIRRVDATI